MSYHGKANQIGARNRAHPTGQRYMQPPAPASPAPTLAPHNPPDAPHVGHAKPATPLPRRYSGPATLGAIQNFPGLPPTSA